MTQETNNHNWTIPTDDGDTGQWGEILNTFFDDELDRQVVLEGPYSELPFNSDAKFYLATDRRILYYNDGSSSWSAMYGLGDSNNPVPEPAFFDEITAESSITDAAGVEHTGQLAEAGASDVALQTVALDNGESTEVAVPVQDGEELNVSKWGAYRVPQGDAPDGLEVQLLDNNDGVVHRDNTVVSNGSSLADLENTSGSPKVFKLRAANYTGGDISGTTTLSTKTSENFESSPLNAYIGSPSEWDTSTESAVGSQSITTTTDFPTITDANRLPAPQMGDSFSFHMRTNVADTGNYHVGYFLFGMQDADDYYELRIGFSDASMELYKRVDGSATWLGSSTSGVYTADQWHRFDVNWNDGSGDGFMGEFEITAVDLSDNSIVETWSATDSSVEFKHGGIGFDCDIDTANSGQLWVDDVTIDRTVEQGVSACFDYEVS